MCGGGWGGGGGGGVGGGGRTTILRVSVSLYKLFLDQCVYLHGHKYVQLTVHYLLTVHSCVSSIHGVLMQHAGIELGPHRYDATLQSFTLCYTHLANSAKLHNTRARGRSRRGTLSKMASFIVDSCQTRDFHSRRGMGARTIAWGRCTPLTIVDQFGIN